mgnify:CR=1 FL=1
MCAADGGLGGAGGGLRGGGIFIDGVWVQTVASEEVLGGRLIFRPAGLPAFQPLPKIVSILQNWV